MPDGSGGVEPLGMEIGNTHADLRGSADGCGRSAPPHEHDGADEPRKNTILLKFLHQEYSFDKRLIGKNRATPSDEEFRLIGPRSDSRTWAGFRSIRNSF